MNNSASIATTLVHQCFIQLSRLLEAARMLSDTFEQASNRLLGPVLILAPATIWSTRKCACKATVKIMQAINAEILDHSPMQSTVAKNYCVIHMPSHTLMIGIGVNRSGDCHVAQIRSCDRCYRYAERGNSRADARLCLVRRLARWLGLARWMGARVESRLGACLGTRLGLAPLGLGLGWTAFRCGARVLRRGLCRSPPCPRSVGSALDFSQSVLVVTKQPAGTTSDWS